MQKQKNAYFKITSFHKKYLQDFTKKLKLLCGNSLIKTGSKNIKKKNTILKSPHVNKKARDQIEIQHISHFFKIKSKFNFLFFLLNFKLYNNTSVQITYKHFYVQKIFYLP